MVIRIAEHQTVTITFGENPPGLANGHSTLVVHTDEIEIFRELRSPKFKESINRFTIIQDEVKHTVQISADYCIGIGHLGNTGRYVQVEPKLNKRAAKEFEDNLEEDSGKETIIPANESSQKPDWVELDYLKMFLTVMEVPESARWSEGLIQIDWDEKAIEIESKDDLLTPLLIVQFLNLLKSIVRKGLRKSYYKVDENLNNRIKGKVLVGQQIKQNILKSRLTKTYCSYEVFGTDNAENRFLKKVLQFVTSYIENHRKIFNTSYPALRNIIAYCQSSFENIDGEVKEYDLKYFKPNPFFKEYKDCIRIGQLILKRFAYNFTQTTQQKITTPPFWIDMPRLFELYVFSKMVLHNPGEKKHLHYQFSTYGNALDILVSNPDMQMVIDAKYKLKYERGHLHSDIRQVAGYARLNKVREELRIKDDRNIDCVIIYPDLENGLECLSLNNISLHRTAIGAYHKMHKIGVKLPLIIE